jgi:6-phosphogluconolactonase
MHDQNGYPLDFVILGIGTDGHTASLFPYTSALTEGKQWIVFTDGETVAHPRPRMTMTFAVLNSARELAILAIGKEKILKEISKVHADVDRYPILGIVKPDQKWFISSGS